MTLSKEDLEEFVKVCSVGFEKDLEDNASWRAEVEEIRKMAVLESDEKTYPWPDASNLKYPLILITALQFNARAYPTIINDGNIVLPKIIGDDPTGQKQERGERVSKHMSWQLTEEMDDWDAGMDALLMGLPIDGCEFKKVYFDPDLERNVSKYIECLDLVVSPDTTSLVSCPRVSHVISYYPYEVKNFIDEGLWEDKDYGIDWESNSQEPEEFVEQHVMYDLGDGFLPYIMTFHRASRDLARVVDNWDDDDNKKQFFVKYECFPDPEGGFYGKGFGQLLKPISDGTDSILNQLIDAGHLANTGGGFLAKSFRVQSGALRFTPGEWKKVDTGGLQMKDAILPLPVRDPSPVLFNLLGLLVDAGKEIASVQDVMTGGGGANMPATTVLAQIEQGMKIYTAIFKRIYRSLRDELILLYKLNGEYLEDKSYFGVMDDKQAIAKKDYETESADIAPAADPSMATDIQKAAKAQVLMQYADWPEANRVEIMRTNLLAAGETEPDKYIKPPPTGPSPEQMEAMAELNLKKEELELKKQQYAVKAILDMANAFEKMAKADELGPDHLLNVQEAMLALAEVLTGQENYERGKIQQVEGGQPLAVPGPQGPQGTPGPTGL